MPVFEPKPFGKYFLVEKLAVGGMAEIYKAKTFGVDGFEKLLAIKKILPHCSADKEFISMLTDEAKLVVRLSHTNIVQIYDLGKVGDDYYISMEYIDGVNLRELVTRSKEIKQTIPVPLCLYIISEVCKGLDYAHSKRDENSRPLHIVHRDISPQNILISFEGETKIVDFGIAKAAMNISQTTAGILKGKVTYMSPEQALGKPVDHRTDIFSAGILLYELLTGNRLFTGETHFHVLKQIQTTQITEDTLSREISPELKQVLAKALAYNPKERYESASDFQIALTKILYSQYSDFSAKKLGGLVQNWFAPELKVRKRQTEIQSTIDTKTRAQLDHGRQETLVRREKTGSLSDPLLIDTTKPEDSVGPGAFKHPPGEVKLPKLPPVLPHKKRSRVPLYVLIVLLLIGGAFYAWTEWKKIPKEETPKKEPVLVPEILEPEIKKEPITEEPKTPSPEIKKGSLLLKSIPSGAHVTIDGVVQESKTPITLKDLEAGKTLKITFSLENYNKSERKVVVQSDRSTELNVMLDPIPPPPETAQLEIQSNVRGAKVFVNGKEAGKTPFTYKGEPGEVTLRLEKKGYKALEKKMKLAQGDEKKIVMTMEYETPPVVAPQPQPKPHMVPPRREKDISTHGSIGQVRIDSNPRGAAVVFDGAKSGITPILIPAVSKNKMHSIRLSLPGYRSWSHSFELTKNYVEINANLQRE